MRRKKFLWAKKKHKKNKMKRNIEGKIGYGRKADKRRLNEKNEI